jgi:hypothetical protein
VLAGPFPTVESAIAGRVTVVEGLPREPARESRPERFVAERVAAVEVRRGVLVGPWRQFRPTGGAVADGVVDVPEPAESTGLTEITECPYGPPAGDR